MKDDNQPKIYYEGMIQKQVQKNYHKQQHDGREYPNKVEQDHSANATAPVQNSPMSPWVPILRQQDGYQNLYEQVGSNQGYLQNMDANHWQHGFSDSMKTSNWQYNEGNEDQGKDWHGYDKGKNPWV